MAVTNLNNSHSAQAELEKLEPREQMLEIAFDFHTMCTDSRRNHLYCVLCHFRTFTRPLDTRFCPSSIQLELNHLCPISR